MNDQKECRICFETTNQKEMLSPCDCSGTMAYIHSHCLKNSIELNEEQNCHICDQNWRGITIQLKNKNFFDYIKEETNLFLFYFSLIFVLYLFGFSFVITSIVINEENKETLGISGAFCLINSLFHTFLVTLKYKKWGKNNFKTIMSFDYNSSNGSLV